MGVLDLVDCCFHTKHIRLTANRLTEYEEYLLMLT